MSQVQVPKISTFMALGPEADSVVVTKLSTFMLLVPGDGGGDEVNTRQGYAYAQKIRRG